jgi:hypothetical protein
MQHWLGTRTDECAKNLHYWAFEWVWRHVYHGLDDVPHLQRVGATSNTACKDITGRKAGKLAWEFV